jgi:surface protein
MFKSCSSLEYAPVFDLLNVTTTEEMYYGCSSLTDTGVLDLPSVTTTKNMFFGCNSLTVAQLTTTSALTNTYRMFYGCSNLPTVNVFDTSGVTNASGMFEYCSSLTYIPAFDLSSATSATLFHSVGNYVPVTSDVFGIRCSHGYGVLVNVDEVFGNLGTAISGASIIFFKADGVNGQYVWDEQIYGYRWTRWYNLTIAYSKGWAVYEHGNPPPPP